MYYEKKTLFLEFRKFRNSRRWLVAAGQMVTGGQMVAGGRWSLVDTLKRLKIS